MWTSSAALTAEEEGLAEAAEEAAAPARAGAIVEWLGWLVGFDCGQGVLGAALDALACVCVFVCLFV